MTPEELELKAENSISPDLQHIKRNLEEKVGLNVSFDVCYREMKIGDKGISLFYMNGLVDDQILTDVLTRFTYVEEQELEPDMLHALFEKYIPHIQVELVTSFEQVMEKVLAGATGLFIEGARKCILIDAKNFPSRSPEEPALERVVRGSRDGFVETLLVNVSLVRRRLRDPRLALEILVVGERTKTDVCLAYIRDITDMHLVTSIRDKISQVKIDGIPLADKQLEEIIVRKGWNPYPLVRYTERPDVVASMLLDGHVAVFVDTTPSVMILPTTFFHLVQHAEENRQTPFVGTYLRWVRFLGIFASLFMLPLWFLLVIQPELAPSPLNFIGPTETGKIPLLVQFLLVEIGVDLMRLAALHTPTPLATAMGLIAAVLIGDIAIQAGLFVNEVILYMAVAAVGMFATPNYELGMANRIVRLMLLILVALFKVPGLVVGSTVILIILALQRSHNTPYMWPFIPFNARAMLEVLLRRPVPAIRTRDPINKTTDSTKMPKSDGSPMPESKHDRESE